MNSHKPFKITRQCSVDVVFSFLQKQHKNDQKIIQKLIIE